MTTLRKALAPLMLAVPLYPAWGAEESGYDLWLRYRTLEGRARTQLLARARSIVLPSGR